VKEFVQEMRAEAARLLSSGEVEMVIGWKRGDLWWQSYPVFIESPEEAESLTWNPCCVPNLAKYLIVELKHRKKIALFLKGCDALGLNQLLQDKRIAREQVYIVGIPCRGLVDPAKVEKAGLDRGLQEVDWKNGRLVFRHRDGEKQADPSEFMYEKCRTCRYPNPVVFDRMLGEPVEVKPRERFTEVERLEKRDVDERYEYWRRQFSRCIRCFACRNVCPSCNCLECIFDIDQPRWLGKSCEPSETQFYHITRAFHLAGRCVECGECERVCPAGIPLMSLNRKLIKDVNELYGEYDAGVKPEEAPPLVTFNQGDPAAFLES